MKVRGVCLLAILYQSLGFVDIFQKLLLNCPKHPTVHFQFRNYNVIILVDKGFFSRALAASAQRLHVMTVLQSIQNCAIPSLLLTKEKRHGFRRKCREKNKMNRCYNYYNQHDSRSYYEDMFSIKNRLVSHFDQISSGCGSASNLTTSQPLTILPEKYMFQSLKIKEPVILMHAGITQN